MTAPTSSTALGPYLAWMYGPGRAFDFFSSDRADKDHSLAGVIERPDGHTATSTPAPLTGGGLTVPLLAPTLWAGLPEPKFVPFVMDGVTAQALTDQTLSDLFGSAAGAGVSTPSGGLGPKSAGTTRLSPGAPIRTDSVIAAPAAPPQVTVDPAVDPSKPIVVIGIIDDGIPFAHKELAPQMEAVWLQGMAADASGSVRFGRELNRDAIAALLASEGPDEDAVYRAAGALGGEGRAQSPLIGDVTHGAHTLGALAAGSDAQVRIVAVDLPPEATWDTSGPGKEAFMLAGLHYIFERADAIAAAYGVQTLPMVVNVSYGYYGGGHDGSSLIEAAFDEMVEARRALAPTAFTMPAGNAFIDSIHAAIPLSAGAEAEPLMWRLPPDDRTSTFMEVWLPAGANATDLSLTLHGPGAVYGPPGPVTATLDGAGNAGQTTVTPVLWNGATVGQLSVDQTRGGRWRYLLALAPTEALNGPAPAGAWHVALKDKRSSGPDITARLRVQRDVSYGRGNTGARQSYFFDPENALLTKSGAMEVADSPTSPIARRGTLNGMATGATSLIVGAANGWGDGAELYSGAAHGSDPAQVDLSVTVSKNQSEVGRLGLTARSGPRMRMTGTSMAAPALGGALRDHIATATAAEAASNYKATLSRAGLLEAANPDAPERLGSDTLK